MICVFLRPFLGMTNPVRFADGMLKVMDGETSSTSVPLDDFPPLCSDSTRLHIVAASRSSPAAGPSSSLGRILLVDGVLCFLRGGDNKLQFMALIVKEGRKTVVISKSIFYQGSSFGGIVC